jgi:hypothetical protein
MSWCEQRMVRRGTVGEDVDVGYHTIRLEPGDTMYITDDQVRNGVELVPGRSVRLEFLPNDGGWVVTD